ncbi:hypothetical protein NUW58_g8864 [Xylaria curta]|uniref:Uncharacterized protein n=1 Tax=Xylaria curta TaxID=42375 RepID=A0ACC1N4E7_9PEZI|nr:hypothetical protein NUW58_g8864 [Xylaria curta]
MSPAATTPEGHTGSLPNGSPKRVGESLAILGCGIMGTAILLGVLSAQASHTKSDGANLLPSRFRACVRRPESADSISSQLPPQALGSTVTLHTSNNVSVVQEADMVLLACQPHLVKPILEEPGMAAALEGKLIMSVLAGVTSEEIENHLQIAASHDEGAYDVGNRRFSVIRVMPNIASAKKKGKVSYTTYLIFTALQTLAAPIALLLTPPEKVQRADGSKVIIKAEATFKGELKALWKASTRRDILLLLPIFWAAYFNQYSGNFQTS